MAHSMEEHPAADHAEHIHLPKPTFWPLVFGLGLGLVAFGLLYSFAAPAGSAARWAVAAAGAVVLTIGVGGWLWSNIQERMGVPPIAPAEISKFAMWCFLGTEVIIFGALIARVVVLWSRDPSVNDILSTPFSSLLLVSVNTFVLLVSSLAVVLALSAIQHGSRRGLVGWLTVVALLGAAFVGIQAYEYNKLFHEGLTLTSSQFGSAFFFLTGNHGLHVVIGVIWCVVVILRALQGGFTVAEHLGVEVFGLYWHFVDVVWIMIFTVIYLI